MSLYMPVVNVKGIVAVKSLHSPKDVGTFGTDSYSIGLM